MNSQNKLSAKAFVKPDENIYADAFNSILRLIILAHLLMLQSENGIDGLAEELLRNKLLKYIKQKQGTFGLAQYVFDAESAEIDEVTDITKGYNDIRITIPTNDAFSEEEQKHYTVECKRLDGNSEKNKAYIEEGIFRFITGKYASKMSLAGMVGFIEKSNKKVEGDRITAIIDDINNKLTGQFAKADCEKLTNVSVDQNFRNSYQSKHSRDNHLGNIDITHLFLDNTIACINS